MELDVSIFYLVFRNSQFKNVGNQFFKNYIYIKPVVLHFQHFGLIPKTCKIMYQLDTIFYQEV